MEYIIAIGTNLEREKNLDFALKRLKKEFTLVATSSVYETSPYGYQNQPNFYNMIVKIRTELSPEEVLKRLQKIENEAGRERKIKWGPRSLDLDIVLWSGGRVKTENLTIPHYDLKNRLFFILPLLEIEGDIELDGENLFYLANRLLPYQGIRKIDFPLP